MIYPALDFFIGGGGLLIAVIATLHVFVAHFAVGGGLFLVLTERKAIKDENPSLVAYVKQSTRFFMLLTMVFGGLSGVGIWFTIGILSPEATGKLIEVFLFAWAAEWVFFAVEIAALLVYWYRFDTLLSKHHQGVGWLYFVSAWLSLFIINGVISFMLTPGAWLETNRFVDAFFNPSFLPSLFFRTAMAVWCAGLFGFFTVNFSKSLDVKLGMQRFYTTWVVGVGFCALVLGRWYMVSIPSFHLEGRYESAVTVSQLLGGFTWVTVGVMVLVAFTGFLRWQKGRRVLACLLLLAGLTQMGLFEMAREHARKPWLVNEVLYANSLAKSDLSKARMEGFHSIISWVRKEGLATGKELFKYQCLPCHSLNGPINDLVPLAKRYTPEGLSQVLFGQGTLHPYMPPFFGDSEDRTTLSHWLTSRFHGKKEAKKRLPKEGPKGVETQKSPVLLTWRSGGRSRLVSPLFISEGRAQPQIEAMLLEPGEFPESVVEGHSLSFLSDQGKKAFVFNEEKSAWEIKGDPSLRLVSGVVEAESEGAVVNRVSLWKEWDERGCFHCHGGEETYDGIGRETAKNILKVHDKNSGTQLATFQRRVVCSRCHQGKRPSPSAAIHGWHNAYFADKNEVSCQFCHGGRPHNTPDFFSGIHQEVLSCTDCHGELDAHAASLLAPYAVAEVVPLKAQIGGEAAKAPARKAWEQQPDCLSCHDGFQGADPLAVGVNSHAAERFSNRLDEMGVVRCNACHGKAHGLYPASDKILNRQSLAYMGQEGVLGSVTCTVCHIEEMEDGGHHDGMVKNR